MADAQIKFVTKSPPGTHQSHITHVGGDSWTWTREKAIRSIEAKENTFFTLVGGKRATVAVVDGPHGKYLRTHADGTWNDNLLALPACVAAVA